VKLKEHDLVKFKESIYNFDDSSSQFLNRALFCPSLHIQSNYEVDHGESYDILKTKVGRRTKRLGKPTSSG